MLLVSAFVLSCQLSNLEVLFARIVTKTSSPSAPQTHGSTVGRSGYVDDDDDIVAKAAPDEDGTDGNDSEDCQGHKELVVRR